MRWKVMSPLLSKICHKSSRSSVTFRSPQICFVNFNVVPELVIEFCEFVNCLNIDSMEQLKSHISVYLALTDNLIENFPLISENNIKKPFLSSNMQEKRSGVSLIACSRWIISINPLSVENGWFQQKLEQSQKRSSEVRCDEGLRCGNSCGRKQFENYCEEGLTFEAQTQAKLSCGWGSEGRECDRDDLNIVARVTFCECGHRELTWIIRKTKHNIGLTQARMLEYSRNTCRSISRRTKITSGWIVESRVDGQISWRKITKTWSSGSICK